MSSAIFVGPTYALSQRVSDDTLELSLPPQRACDRCRRRKQKCDGLKDCLNCKRSALICTYHAAPKRRGPKRRKVIPWSRSALNTNSLEFQQSENESPASDDIGSLPVSTPEACTALPEHGIDDSSVFNPFTVDGSSHDSYDTPNSAYYPESAVHSGSDVFDDGDSESFQFPSTADEPIRARSSVTTREDDNCPNCALTRFQLQPYLQYFFDYLYPIFPVLDITKFQDEFLDDPNLPLSTNEYALLTALSAAISAQLNLSGLEESITTVYHDSIAAPHRLIPSADFLIAQCLDTRRQAGYIDATDEYTVLTSFFLFYYYGNFNQSQSAWYHLREAIHFALMLQLNNSRTYDGMVSDKEQRLRRIYWLLYVTERAYALQTGGYTILQPSIEVPTVFQSGNPRLVYGFVVLINVFRSVNQYNLTSGCEDSVEAAPVSKEIVSNNAFGSQDLDETQRMDIEVTRHWLRVLALRKRPSGGMVRDHLIPLHALNVSKDLLGIITSARRQSLEVHGIGMEQKLFDVACVLSNVIQDTPSISPDNFSAAHNMLHSFMRLLVSFRNRESQYLQPLLQQATKSLARGISVPQPLALDAPEHPGFDSED